MRRFLKRPTHVPGEVGALSGCRPVLAFIPLRERPAGVFGLELLSGMMWPGRAGTGYLLNFKSVRAASRLALWDPPRFQFQYTWISEREIQAFALKGGMDHSFVRR